jgi:hypothetical protein
MAGEPRRRAGARKRTQSFVVPSHGCHGPGLDGDLLLRSERHHPGPDDLAHARRGVG